MDNAAAAAAAWKDCGKLAAAACNAAALPAAAAADRSAGLDLERISVIINPEDLLCAASVCCRAEADEADDGSLLLLFSDDGC